MRILITNTELVNFGGTQLYVRDVALELRRLGHTPVVYSPRLGPMADSLRRETVLVVDQLSLIGEAPDIIHAHHHLETMAALTRFPETPAVYFCHGWLPWQETAPRHPRIRHYVAVGELLREHLIFERGVAPDDISVIRNFVDLERFQPRGPLPARPKRALILSNQAQEGNYVRAVRAACKRHGIHLDVIGHANGNATDRPEEVLGNYDLVFARGRSAMEAMAVGAAVVCCDLEGLGPLVTTSNLEWLRRNNLGIRVLSKPLTAEAIGAVIERFDAADAAAVTQAFRADGGLQHAVHQIMGVYERALQAPVITPDAAAEGQALVDYLAWLSRTVPHELIMENQRLLERVEALNVVAHSGEGILRAEMGEPGAKARLRAAYHVLVPLKARLRLRNLRQRMLGR